MRLAVFSDVHGNYLALDAVLDQIDRMGPFDRIIAAGDLCMGGSDPLGCLKLLQIRQIECVYGNTDRYLSHPKIVPPDALHKNRWPEIKADVGWVNARLSRVQVEWLGQLPFKIRIRPTQRDRDEILIVHANPINLKTMIYPDPATQKAIWGSVVQPDDDPELLAGLAQTRAGALAFGHLHYGSTRRLNGTTLLNVGSVSLPVYGPDLAVRFSIVEWTGSAWTRRIQTVSYDTAAEMTALKHSGMPGSAYYLSAYRRS